MEEYTINLVRRPIPLTTQESSLFTSTKKFDNKYRWISKLKNRLNDVVRQMDRNFMLNMLKISVDSKNVKVSNGELVSFPIIFRTIFPTMQQEDKKIPQEIIQGLVEKLPEIIHQQSPHQYIFRKQQTQKRQIQFLSGKQQYQKFINFYSLTSSRSPYHIFLINLILKLKHLPPFSNLLAYSTEQREKIIEGMIKDENFKGLIDTYIGKYIDSRWKEFSDFLNEQNITLIHDDILKSIKVFKWVYADFPTPKLAQHRLQILSFLSSHPPTLFIRLDPYQSGKLLAKRIISGDSSQVKIFRILQQEDGEEDTSISSEQSKISKIPNVMIQQVQHQQIPPSERILPFSRIVKKD
uniref:Uncharacterized protein n=1 Tax=viral metagenome TaxID=1070528 RepID=A0A6C0D1X2_9ZZZZ